MAQNDRVRSHLDVPAHGRYTFSTAYKSGRMAPVHGTALEATQGLKARLFFMGVWPR